MNPKLISNILESNKDISKKGLVMLNFKKVHKNAILPKYRNKGDAGFDFCAVVDFNNCNAYLKVDGEQKSIIFKDTDGKDINDNINDILKLDPSGESVKEKLKIVPVIAISPKERTLVDTGLQCAFPQGYELQIRPRSGLAIKNGITVLNSPGTVDCYYRGNIKVIMINHGNIDFIINNGDRIAQGVFCSLPSVDIVEVSDFSDEEKLNDRGGGFGSTGVK